MNQNLIRVIETVGKEKGISKAILISAVEAAIISACKRNFSGDVTLKSQMDPETGDIKLFQTNASRVNVSGIGTIGWNYFSNTATGVLEGSRFRKGGFGGGLEVTMKAAMQARHTETL